MVAWSKFHTEDKQILGTTAKKLVAIVTWSPGFMHDVLDYIFTVPLKLCDSITAH
jgi:hypothetical protein